MDIFNCLEKLFEGKEIKKEISPFFTFEELERYNGIWQLMVYNGYLKLNKKFDWFKLFQSNNENFTRR